MIHFNFIVSDADAENIMDFMQKQIQRNNYELLFHLDKPGQDSLAAAYRKDNEYIEGLIKKMTHTRID